MKSVIIAATSLLIAPFAFATEITVSYSEKLQEKFEDDYGVREIERLSEDLTEAVNRRLEAKGLEPTKVELTVERARPNRPTFQQMSDEPSLDFRSFGTGGAEVTGIVYNADGEAILEMNYDWFESDIRFAQGRATWTDTKRAFDKFANKLARTLEEMETASS